MNDEKKINLSEYGFAQIKGPKIRDIQSISKNKHLFLILLSVAMTFINYIAQDKSIQMDFHNYVENTSENNKQQYNYDLNYTMIDILSDIPNCFITPLIFGYLSDFISIGYLMNLTSFLMLISTIILYFFFVFGYPQLYIISRILYYISNEGLQNSTFNLIYEYSNTNKMESRYFCIHTIIGYNIPRILPFIFYLIYDNDENSKNRVIDNKSIYFSQYLIFNAIACVIMLFVSYSNKKKEFNEERQNEQFFITRISPQEKFNFFQAFKFIVFGNKSFMIQCIYAGILVGFTSMYFQCNTLIQAMVQQANFELILDIDFSTKGFTQILSILLIYSVGKHMDTIENKYKFYLLWYNAIGLGILIALINFILLIENSVINNIIVYLFLLLLGLQYYCTFMAINSIIYEQSGWFQRGMGYGLFSCSYNFFQTLTYFLNYYVTSDYPVQISVIIVVLVIILVLAYDYLKISEININNSYNENNHSNSNHQ